MEIEIVRNQNHNYACIKLTEGEAHVHECNMLSYNQLTCLLPLNMRYVDNLLQVEYDLCGMQSLSAFLMRQRLTQEQLQWLVNTLLETQEELLEYLLSPDGLVLEPDYVFVEPSNRKLRFCYQPGGRNHVEQNIQPFLQYILDHVDYTDQQAVTLAYALYHLENGTGNILGTMAAYVNKTAMQISGKDVEDETEEALTRTAALEEPYPARISNRSGLLYRLFHRESKRELLLEHAQELAGKETGCIRV